MADIALWKKITVKFYEFMTRVLCTGTCKGATGGCYTECVVYCSRFHILFQIWVFSEDFMLEYVMKNSSRVNHCT